MSGDRVFVDTNVLVYAHDASAGSKRDRAQSIVRDLWESGDGCLSIQVLEESFVAVTRKVPQPLEIDKARALVAELSQWDVHSPDSDDVLEAIDLHRRRSVTLLEFHDHPKRGETRLRQALLGGPDRRREVRRIGGTQPLLGTLTGNGGNGHDVRKALRDPDRATRPIAADDHRRCNESPAGRFHRVRAVRPGRSGGEPDPRRPAARPLCRNRALAADRRTRRDGDRGVDRRGAHANRGHDHRHRSDHTGA